MTEVSFENLGNILAGLDNKSAAADAGSRRQAALLAFGRKASACPPQGVLLLDAAALLAEIVEADVSGLAQVAGDGLVLKLSPLAAGADRPVAKPHRSSLAPGESMAGYALSVARPVTSSNLAAETRFHDGFLCQLGVSAALTVPLHLDKRPYGALAAYSTEPREFSDDDLGFAETVAHLVGSSIVRARSEEARQEQNRLLSAVLEMIGDLVIVLDPQGFVRAINAACRQVTGFAPAEVCGKPFGGVFAVPSEVDRVQTILRRAARSKSGDEFQSLLLTKDGDRRQISWSLRPTCDARGAVQSIVLAGSDNTELATARDELERMRRMAGQNARALRELRQRAAEAPLAADGSPRAQALPAPGSPAAAHAPPAGGAEKRRSQRCSYRYRQRIAPMVDDRLPAREQFVEVDCEDISAGGLAFYADRPPTYENLVVALGKPPDVSCFSARVVRVVDRSEDGVPRYLIGCNFTGRLPTSYEELG